MLGVGSSAPPRCDSWDMMEHERYQHCFYDYRDPEHDFYTCTAPSEDIWKKFELELEPTPPLSPSRTAEGAGGCAAHASPSPGERLDWLSGVSQDEEQDSPYKIDTEEVFGNLSSIILQDCMWSGFEKVVSDRLAGSSPSKVPVAVHSGPNPCAKAQSAQLDVATDCVDPAAVLTFPISSCKKQQASSGTESRTDSSDDDEEIDVVTVESKQNKGRLVGRKPVTITVRADPHDPGMKRFHISIHQQQHNYAAPSPDSPRDVDPEPPRKRPKPEPAAPVTTHQHHLQHREPRSRPGSRPSSPQSSDCEDLDRRKTHNYLERKRRNDLCSRFLALRDQIPGLADCPKTPKVVILTKAREYLRLLHTSERLQAQERKHLRAQQQQLLRKLAHLKRQNSVPGGEESC